MTARTRERDWFAPDAVCSVGGGLSVVLVRGCASRFVRRTAYYAQHAAWVRRPGEIDVLAEVDAIPGGLAARGHRPGEHLVALWRDPVDRFASVFGEWCIERVPHPYAAFLTLQVEADWHRFLEFARWELSKPRASTMVEHLRPQSAVWTPPDVDEVVDAADVRALFRRHGVRYRPFVSPLRPSRPTPPADVAGVVRQLYAADYDLRP